VPQITERWFWTGIRALYKEPRAAASPPPPLVDDDGAAINEVV
jgi:hypothetical protein